MLFSLVKQENWPLGLIWPEVKGAVRVKQESYQAWLASGTVERSAALVLTDAKT